MRRRFSLLFLCLFTSLLFIASAITVNGETRYSSYYLRDGNLAVYPQFLPPDTSYFLELPTYTSPTMFQFVVFNCSNEQPLYVGINGNVTTITKEGVYKIELSNKNNKTMVIHFVLYTDNKILLSSTFYLEPEPKTPEYLKFLPSEFQKLVQQIKLQQIMFGIGAGLVGVYYSVEVKKKTKIKAHIGYIALILPAGLGIAVVSAGIIEGYHLALMSIVGLVTYQLTRDYAFIYSIVTLSKGEAKKKHRFLTTDIPVSDDFKYVLYPNISLRPFQLVRKKRFVVEDEEPIFVNENPGVVAKNYQEKDDEFYVKGDPALTQLLIDHGILEKRTLELKDLQEKFREISIAFDLLSDRKAWRQFEAYRYLRDRRFERNIVSKDEIMQKVKEEMKRD